jgi:hypothetical protein
LGLDNVEKIICGRKLRSYQSFDVEFDVKIQADEEQASNTRTFRRIKSYFDHWLHRSFKYPLKFSGGYHADQEIQASTSLSSAGVVFFCTVRYGKRSLTFFLCSHRDNHTRDADLFSFPGGLDSLQARPC